MILAGASATGGLAGGMAEAIGSLDQLDLNSETGMPGAEGGREATALIELKNWIQWHLALEDYEFLVEVEREYILDEFNLIKLRDSCGTPPPMNKKRFKQSLKLILSSKVPSEEDLKNPAFLELN